MGDSRPVFVLGGGGHAHVVLATLQAAKVPIAAVLDDDPALQGKQVLGVQITGAIDSLEDTTQTRAILAVGDNQIRQHLATCFSNVQWVSAVHPRAYIHASVQLGSGSVVFAGAVIQPGTVVGAHSIVNTGATIDHDCVVGAYVHLAPGSHVAGNVHIGEGALLGIGASVIPEIKIGAWSVIGAGAAVVRDIPDRVTAVGVPARPIVDKHGEQLK